MHKEKLIEVGWDSPDTKQMREGWKRMEETSPFDGVVCNLKFVLGRESYDENKILSPNPWKREQLRHALDDMKACKFSKFTDNFIRVNTAPGNLRWDDDKAWGAATANMGLVAWFAKKSGSKSVAFDPESYAAPQYQWLPESGTSFDGSRALARKRGFHMIKKVSKEYPDISFFAFWLLSLNSQNVNAPDSLISLRSEKYGLWPAFVTGMLEAAPSTVKFIDANENGYYADDRNGYYALYNLARGANNLLRSLLPNELRDKYNRQVSSGFGFYLDRYLNLPTDKYCIPPLPGGDSLERQGSNLKAAMETSDEYVWACGEQCRWWKSSVAKGTSQDGRLKNTVGKGRFWEEAMPGITLTLNTARDPNIAVLEAVTRRSPEKNLAINPGFDQEKSAGKSNKDIIATDWQFGAVPGFAQWQSDDSKGVFFWDGNFKSGNMKAVKNGCFIQKYRVRSGEKFLVEVEGKGAGDRLLIARWQTSDEKWSKWDQDLSFGFKLQPDSRGIARGIVTVLETAGQLILLLAVNYQKADESCRFDNLCVYRMQGLFKTR